MRTLTLDDVRTKRYRDVSAPVWAHGFRVRIGEFKVVCAPIWAYAGGEWGRGLIKPIAEAWAPLLAELQRRADDWHRQALHDHEFDVVDHAEFLERLNAGQLTPDQMAWVKLRARMGANDMKPPATPELLRIVPLYPLSSSPMRTCRRCGEDFYCTTHGGASRYCSLRCWKAARKDRPRESRAKYRAMRPCDECGVRFKPARSDARFCSTRCRVAAHRAKLEAMRDDD